MAESREWSKVLIWLDDDDTKLATANFPQNSIAQKNIRAFNIQEKICTTSSPPLEKCRIAEDEEEEEEEEKEEEEEEGDMCCWGTWGVMCAR